MRIALALLVLTLTEVALAQKQYTLNNGFGPVATSPTGFIINTTFFQSVAFNDGKDWQGFIYQGANKDIPLLGLTYVESGPLLTGNYDTAATFGAGGKITVSGNAACCGVFRLDGKFLGLEWRRVAGPGGTNLYQITGTLNGILKLAGVNICSGAMTVSGRTVNTRLKPWSQTATGGRFLQNLSVNATRCQ